MNDFETDKSQQLGPQSQQIIRFAFIFYGFMGLIGLFVMRYIHHNMEAVYLWPLLFKEVWAQLAVVGASLLLLIVTGYILEDYSESYRSILQELKKLLGKHSYVVGFLLAVMSGMSEEVFFRGALYPWLGLWGSSIVFGLMHIHPEQGINLWSLWAMFAGLLLALVYQYTESLVPCMIIHFMNNWYGLWRLQYQFRRESKP